MPQPHVFFKIHGFYQTYLIRFTSLRKETLYYTGKFFPFKTVSITFLSNHHKDTRFMRDKFSVRRRSNGFAFYTRCGKIELDKYQLCDF